VHAESGVLDVDRPRRAERRVQDVEVVAHLVGRPLVRQAEHALDDPMMRRAEPEREATLAHRLVRHHFLRHGNRVAGLDRQHGGSELDPPRRAAHERDHGEGVEVAGHLRHPDRREAGRLGRFGVGDELRHLVAVASLVRADHQADAHRGLLCTCEGQPAQ
jgi:hypothetical protein